MQVITARLRLPPIDETHLAAMRSGGRVPHWAPDFPTTGDLMIADMYARDGLPRSDHDRLFGHRLVVENETGLAVGGIGVKGPPVDAAVEIGYGIVPSRRGRGYATEAVAGLVSALLGIAEVRTILAQVDPDNTPSARVLVRNGFVRTATDGEHDRYALTRPTTG